MPESEQTTPAAETLIPPTEMLHDGSSTAEEFVLFGENFNQYILIQRAHLFPSAAVLDLGCGNGAVARALTRYLTPPGRYEGVDINGTTIGWLRQHYRDHPNFGFSHADVYNKLYNPAGQTAAGQYRFPFEDRSFDLVLLKSVFTHMLPGDVSRYMGEVSRVLKQGGQSVITYFLLNDESRRFIDRGADAHGLRHEYAGDPLCRVANPDMPEAVVAHDEGRVRDHYAAVGCSVVEMAFGSWCGRRSQLGHQDVIIAVKE